MHDSMDSFHDDEYSACLDSYVDSQIRENFGLSLVEYMELSKERKSLLSIKAVEIMRIKDKINAELRNQLGQQQ